MTIDLTETEIKRLLILRKQYTKLVTTFTKFLVDTKIDPQDGLYLTASFVGDCVRIIKKNHDVDLTEKVLEVIKIRSTKVPKDD